jgi:5-methylcytosine-specific restriction endonuclease McrA
MAVFMRTVGGSCHYCERQLNRPKSKDWQNPLRPTRDHYIPRGRHKPTMGVRHPLLDPFSTAGIEDPRNLVSCCRRCNEEKGSLDGDEYKAWRAGLACRLDHPNPRRDKRNVRVLAGPPGGAALGGPSGQEPS